MTSTTKLAEQTPSIEQQRLLVDRIVASNLFRKSHRLASFLRFICEEQQQGRGHTIHEQRIGKVVFGRPESYHIGEDSIVRSQARFLRLRLQEYFATEGKDEPIVLTVPKGSYVPEFHFREPAAEPAPVAAPTASPFAPREGLMSLDGARQPGLRRAMLTGLAVVALCAAVFIAWRMAVRAGASTIARPEVRFWASIFDPKRSTIVVPADSSLVLIDEMTGTEIHLQDYTTRRYRGFTPPPGMEGLWSVLVESQYTNVADLRIVSQLERLPQVDRTKTQIRFARDLSVSEVKQNNVVLLGSARANPWVELFDGFGRFRVGYDPRAKENVVENRDPGPGEKPLYVEEGDANEHLAYGVIAYLPSLDGQSSSLLVGGTSKAGTEAAAEFLLGPEFPKFLNKLAGGGEAPHFELLLSARNLNGNSYQSTVVCYHRLTNAGPR
ncbi:MAG TPA: hypothetical protein VLI45_00410 [Acidobacteriaceae bacterium]|nr:hypothetical protein [Acidobacteriaceae bacterium]